MLAASGVGHVHLAGDRRGRDAGASAPQRAPARAGPPARPVPRPRRGHPTRERRGAACRPAQQLPALAVLAGPAADDLALAATLTLARVPHVAVTAAADRAVVGPLVLPGRSSCLWCLHRHRVDADPDWPAVHRAASRSAPPASTVVRSIAVSLAAHQVLAALDGLVVPRMCRRHARVDRRRRHDPPPIVDATRRVRLRRRRAGLTSATVSRLACCARATRTGRVALAWRDAGSQWSGVRHPQERAEPHGAARQPAAVRGRPRDARPRATARRAGPRRGLVGDAAPNRRAALRGARHAQGRGDEVRPGAERLRGRDPRGVRGAVPGGPDQAAERRAADARRRPCTGCWPQQFGRGWRTQFRDFDDTAAAAASIGQVHRGDLARRPRGRRQDPVPGRRGRAEGRPGPARPGSRR